MKSKDIIEIRNLKITDDTYIIRWNITKLCNYYCDFCIQGNKEKHIIDSKGENKQLRENICNDIVYFIENKVSKKYNNIQIDLIGGEVTILPDFFEILKILLNSKFDGIITIKLKTNLSFDKKMIKNITELFKDNRKLILSASYYKEFTNEKEFIKKIKLLNKKNIKVLITYPLIEDIDYKNYIKFKNKYKKYTNGINYLAIRDYKKSISNELKEALSKNENEISKSVEVITKNKTYYCSNTNKISYLLDDKHFDPFNYICDAGLQSICIDNLGNISRCPIFKENLVSLDKLDLYDKKIICPYHECNCRYYRKIIKGDKNERDAINR